MQRYPQWHREQKNHLYRIGLLRKILGGFLFAGSVYTLLAMAIGIFPASLLMALVIGLIMLVY